MQQQLLRYVLVGTLTHGINFLVFALLHKGFGLWYIYATVLSGTMAWLVNFPLHRNWTFNDRRGKGATSLQAFAHGSLKFINTYASDPYLLYVAVEKLTLDPLLGKALIGVLLGIQNFILCRYLIFRKPAA